METKMITCTVCPIGCNIRVKGTQEKVLSLAGNQCKRGVSYATAEFLNPERILTTTIKTKNHRVAVIPVRSDKPIPKSLLMEAVKILKEMELEGPISFGDVVISGIVNTDANIVVTGY